MARRDPGCSSRPSCWAHTMQALTAPSYARVNCSHELGCFVCSFRFICSPIHRSSSLGPPVTKAAKSSESATAASLSDGGKLAGTSVRTPRTSAPAFRIVEAIPGDVQLTSRSSAGRAAARAFPRRSTAGTQAAIIPVSSPL